MPIKAPPHLHPDRMIEGAEYLQVAFSDLADAALAAGWTEREVEDTLMEVARTRVTERLQRALAEDPVRQTRRA